MESQILVPIASGTEEMEAVIIVDMLRRAGFSVILAGENELITCSRGVKILPDKLIDNIESKEVFKAIVIPGGGTGVLNLSDNDQLRKIMEYNFSQNSLIGAICAAPTLLQTFKLINSDTELTSHPSVENELSQFNYKHENVVVYNNIITSRGAGTAFEFILEVIRILKGQEIVDKITKDIIWDK
jgi:protein DJ-1